ncbi:MAG: SDR family NAD(P)-dependent oxidoreductase [Bacteroidetes bacterium]|nr:SDR family NAD(P)-dependent oxidoreductase [Bacteroidota bacterium]
MSARKVFQYYRAYQWADIFAMIRNSRLAPKVCTDRFDGKLVVITGATSGIGYCTARKYAAQGANLLCINRNREKSETLRREVEDEFSVQCDCLLADLSSLQDIHRVARELASLRTPIDVLIHNAGVYLTERERTPDGLDKVLVVHHLSSFIINHVLMEKLKAQDKSRIILVSSEGHRFAAWGLRLDDVNWEKRRYTGLRSYGAAKTSQLLSMLVFAERFRDSGVTINAVHPGAVKTETGQENGPLYRWWKKTFYDPILKTPDISAETLYYCGASRELDGVTGRFFNLTTEEKPAPPARDYDLAVALWNTSLELTGLNTAVSEQRRSNSIPMAS